MTETSLGRVKVRSDVLLQFFNVDLALTWGIQLSTEDTDRKENCFVKKPGSTRKQLGISKCVQLWAGYLPKSAKSRGSCKRESGGVDSSKGNIPMG